jgi:mRNA interferase YafQ
MRTIRRTGQFKRDYKRESRGRYRKTLVRDLESVLALLVADSPLPAKLHDHPLAGEWKDFRDCHVHPDFVLIYRKPDAATLELVRLGSHSELGF